LLLGFYLFIQANLESLRLNPRMQVVVGGGAARSLTETLSDRYWFWQRSFEAGMSSPIIGVGASKSVYQLSDNGYLMMFQRAGLVGLTIYLLMIGRLCWRGAKALYVKQESEPRAILLMAFVALVNHVIFEITGDFFWNIAYGGIIAVYLGLLCAASDDVLRNTGLAWSVR
jgi:O-antigen ligase